MPNLNTVINIIWIVLIILMFVFKKNFTLPDTKLSKNAIIFLLISSILIFIINFVIIGIAYYKAYHPDFEYDKISQQVNYHIYRPTYQPEGIEQTMKFFIDEREFAGKTDAVRTYYDLSMLSKANGSKSNPIVIEQTMVEPSFDVNNYFLLKHKDNNTPPLQPITLSNISNKQAYLQTSSTVKTVTVLTTDNIFIQVISPKETEDNLIKIANSLK